MRAWKSVSGTVDVTRFLSMDNDGVALDAVKVSEDGETVVIRLHEYRGSEKLCHLKPGFRCSAYAEASLMEEPAGEFRKVEGALTLRFTPYEIKTLLFKTIS